MDQDFEKRKEKIPKHWEVKRLGDVFTIERGGSPRPIEDYITTDENGINWIKIGDTKNVTKYIYNTQEKIKPEGAKRSRIVNSDDFLLSNSMSFGRPYIMKTTGCIHDGWLVIRKNEIINNDYLYYILSSNSLFQQFSNLAKGSTVKNLNIEAVKRAIIQFPPIAEQKTIVAKIEELFSELEKGKEQLETTLAQLKVYRQSLLQAAFSGKLTHPDVKEGELPEDWKWVKLGDVANISTGVTPLRSNTKYWENGKIPWITSGALNFSYVSEAKEYITELAYKESSLKILPVNTLLIALYGEGKTRGKCSELLLEATTNQAVAGIILKNEYQAYRKYLKLFLLKNYEEIRKLSSGGVQPNLNLGIVKQTEFPLPTKYDQEHIVQILESKLSICDQIEETIKQSIVQAEVLRQSILKRAFEGKLVNPNQNKEKAEYVNRKYRQ